MPLCRLFSGCCRYFIYIIYILSQSTLVGGRLSGLDFFEEELIFCSWIILILSVVFIRQISLVLLTDEKSWVQWLQATCLSAPHLFTALRKQAVNIFEWMSESAPNF